MKKAVVEAWLSGLRSGKYEQTRDQLHNGPAQLECATAFCYIGVLGIVTEMTGYLDTNDVIAKYGLYEWDRRLVDMNDRDKKSFAEIADWIEANILPNTTK